MMHPNKQPSAFRAVEVNELRRRFSWHLAELFQLEIDGISLKRP